MMSVAKSTNEGLTWTRSHLMTAGGTPTIEGFVNSIAVDPSDKNIVYAAGYYMKNAIRLVGGVFRSNDGGGTWTEVGTTIPEPIFVICVDPWNSHRVYAGTESGLYISTDQGISWQSPTTDFYVNCMIGDPAVANRLFVGTLSGVYSSDDGGDSFSEMNMGLSNKDVLCIDYDPTNQTLYVGTNGSGVFRYRMSTYVEERKDKTLPFLYALHPNVPNPFNETTMLRFDLPDLCDVDLSVFNLLGKKVDTVFRGFEPAGTYRVAWKAENLPSGLYLCRLKAGKYVETRKLVFQR